MAHDKRRPTLAVPVLFVEHAHLRKVDRGQAADGFLKDLASPCPTSF